MGRRRFGPGDYTQSPRAVRVVYTPSGVRKAPSGTPKRLIAGWQARGKAVSPDGSERRIARMADSKAEAERVLLNDLKTWATGQQVTHAGRVLPYSFRDAARDWLDAIAGARSPSSMPGHESRARIIGEEPWATLPLERVPVTAVNASISAWGRTYTTSTINVRVAFLNNVFEHAYHTGRTPTLHRFKSGAGRRSEKKRAFTRTEWGRILDACDVRERTMVMVGLNAAARIGELAAIEWTDISQDRLTIGDKTVTAKRGVVPHEGGKQSQRVVRLHADTVAALEAWREEAPESRFVFPGRSKNKPAAITHTTRKLKNLFGKAGCGWATPHTLRRTAATWMHEQGATARAVADALGHDSLRSQDVYALTAEQQLSVADILRI